MKAIYGALVESGVPVRRNRSEMERFCWLCLYSNVVYLNLNAFNVESEGFEREIMDLGCFAGMDWIRKDCQFPAIWSVGRIAPHHRMFSTDALICPCSPRVYISWTPHPTRLISFQNAICTALGRVCALRWLLSIGRPAACN